MITILIWTGNFTQEIEQSISRSSKTDRHVVLGLVRKNQEGLGLLKRLRRKSARKSAKECGSVVPRSGICSSAEKREGDCHAAYVSSSLLHCVYYFFGVVSCC